MTVYFKSKGGTNLYFFEKWMLVRMYVLNKWLLFPALTKLNLNHRGDRENVHVNLMFIIYL